jgi:phage portal protein BeeE
LLLDEALGLPALGMGTELDTEGLLRMDPVSRADVAMKLVGAGVQAPNESRRGENLHPVSGGDSPMIQQQNYSLAAIAKRDAKDDPFATDKPAPAPPAKILRIASLFIESSKTLPIPAALSA